MFTQGTQIRDRLEAASSPARPRVMPCQQATLPAGPGRAVARREWRSDAQRVGARKPAAALGAGRAARAGSVRAAARPPTGRCRGPVRGKPLGCNVGEPRLRKAAARASEPLAAGGAQARSAACGLRVLGIGFCLAPDGRDARARDARRGLRPARAVERMLVRRLAGRLVGPKKRARRRLARLGRAAAGVGGFATGPAAGRPRSRALTGAAAGRRLRAASAARPAALSWGSLPTSGGSVDAVGRPFHAYTRACVS